jgi:hypothetical protein
MARSPVIGRYNTKGPLHCVMPCYSTKCIPNISSIAPELRAPSPISPAPRAPRLPRRPRTSRRYNSGKTRPFSVILASECCPEAGERGDVSCSRILYVVRRENRAWSSLVQISEGGRGERDVFFLFFPPRYLNSQSRIRKAVIAGGRRREIYLP